MKYERQKSKHPWVAPKLTVHGTVEEITHQTTKYIGSEDNMIYIANSTITVGDGS